MSELASSHERWSTCNVKLASLSPQILPVLLQPKHHLFMFSKDAAWHAELIQHFESFFALLIICLQQNTKQGLSPDWVLPISDNVPAYEICISYSLKTALISYILRISVLMVASPLLWDNSSSSSCTVADLQVALHLTGNKFKIRE